jgi:hypothetical protein
MVLRSLGYSRQQIRLMMTCCGMTGITMAMVGVNCMEDDGSDCEDGDTDTDSYK